MIKAIIISIVSFLLFTVISSPLLADNYKVCYALFVKELPGNDTGVAVVKTIDRYRLTNTPGKDFVDWDVELEGQKDLLKLFSVFMAESHLTVDETIWELIKIGFKIKQLERRSLISLADGLVYKVIADIMGFGDIYTQMDKAINHDDSSWYHTLSLWNREELTRTFKEYKELLNLIEALKTDEYNQKILSSISSGKEIPVPNKIDAQDAFTIFTQSIIDMIDSSPGFKNIKQVIGKDIAFWKTFISLYNHPTTQDIFFWYTYVEFLKEKTVAVIKETITQLDILYNKLNRIKRDKYRGSLFLKEHLDSYLDVTATLILKLERLKISVEAIDLKKSGIRQKITNNKLVEAIFGLVSRSLLKTYTNKSVVLFFDSFFELNNDLLSALQVDYMDYFVFNQKDPVKASSIYKYFITLKYDKEYQEYLEGIYGKDTTRELMDVLQNK